MIFVVQQVFLHAGISQKVQIKLAQSPSVEMMILLFCNRTKNEVVVLCKGEYTEVV